jgi:uncharacterized RDD family membrane protein YckC
MDNANPYLPPEAALTIEDDPSIIELAGRGQRLGAAILDAIFIMVFTVPIMYATGIFDYSKNGQSPPFTLMLGMTMISFIIFIVMHGFFLKRNGQTLGKKIVGIRIAGLDDGIPPFQKLIFLRYLPINCVTLIPVVGQILPLIDCLFVFRSDRRCIHDLIASTKVVKIKK